MSGALEDIHKGMDWEVAWLRRHNALEQTLSLSNELIGYSVQRGFDLLRSYYHHGIYQGVPEQRVDIEVPGVDVPIMGYLDLDTKQRVVEFKTSAALWNQVRVDTEIQGTIYWLGHQVLHGTRPSEVRYIIMPTRGLPDIKILDTKRNKQDILKFYDHTRRIWKEMNLGVYAANCPSCRGTSRVRKVSNPPVLVI